MLIDPGFEVPVERHRDDRPDQPVRGRRGLAHRPGRVRTAPSLAPGDTIARTADSDALGNLFAAAAPLFNRVNTKDLTTVITNLAEGSVGEGPQIAASFDEGAKLAALLDSTLQAQLAALDSFARASPAPWCRRPGPSTGCRPRRTWPCRPSTPTRPTTPSCSARSPRSRSTSRRCSPTTTPTSRR